MGRMPSRRKLGALVVRFRGMLAAIGIAFVGLVCMILAQKIATSELYGELLNLLTTPGTVDAKTAADKLESYGTGTFWTSILWTFGGTMVAAGVIGLAWDVWLNLSWLSFVREEIVRAITNPTALSELKRRTNREVLEQSLHNVLGPDIGGALFHGTQQMAKKPRMVRSDFSYYIKLSPISAPHDQHYLKAEFTISFTVRKLAKDLSIAFSRVSDSLEFHSRYQTLVEKGPGAIYRYVLLSDKPVTSDDLFKIQVCRVSSCGNSSDVVDLEVKPEDSIVADGQSFELTAPKAQQGLFKRISGGPCRIDLSITTVVDKNRSEFPICFGYPVRVFRSRLDARDINASYVDILEFFTSSQRFRREELAVLSNGSSGNQSAHQSSAIASGVLDDLILPDSGLTYVWR